LKVENQNKTNQTPFEYLANGEKNNSEWQEYKNYINSFVNIFACLILTKLLI
jgi:CRISPR/Cas system Type II protein with McrA/HNH and RuvC-like nuclease domain